MLSFKQRIENALANNQVETVTRESIDEDTGKVTKYNITYAVLDDGRKIQVEKRQVADVTLDNLMDDMF